MKPIQSFTVTPILPKKLEVLRDLAYNLWWTWNADARDLFSRLDMDLWEETRHNPVALLNRIEQDVLEARAQDDSYIYQLHQVYDKFTRSMKSQTWFEKNKKYDSNLNIAYFSMEYGITECLAVYSGGLGILAGDHLKSASELGIPLFAVGLSYQYGYFQQVFNVDDYQEEEYPVNDFYNSPLTLIKNDKGKQLLVKLPFPGRTVNVRIWKAQVGRIPLYLLDTNIAENSEADKNITAELYGGDAETRIQQEIILGMGGFQALKLLNTPPFICHLNEGHSAFSGLERIRSVVKNSGLTFYEALEIIKSTSVFTTHTPVQAGIDLFDPDLIRRYFDQYCQDVGIDMDELLALGRNDPDNNAEHFSMAILAINLSSKINAVSKLHSQVAQEMWKSLWPDVLTQEIPIDSVTNGTHHSSWVSQELSELYDRYLGPDWHREPNNATIWNKVDKIPDGELWRTHERRRERLVAYARRELSRQYVALGKPQHMISRVKSILSTDALTIGFARRFASYKRAYLIFSDPERLAKILTNKKYPVQIIVAGKAHPHDEEGKQVIRRILRLSHEEPFYQRVTFLENYDMNIARYMVQGCDLWLNNPRRGLEACGTSGMKAVANGGLHFSTIDGWWDEIYRPGIGWAIGTRDTYDDEDYWDHQEANIIYKVLENEIIPAFFDRDSDDLPRNWIAMMKASLKAICPQYNSNRMLSEYTDRIYYPAAVRADMLLKDDYAIAKELAHWKEKMRDNWDSVRFLKVSAGPVEDLSVNSQLKIQAEIYLDGLQVEDVDVQVYYGRVDADGSIMDGRFASMKFEKSIDSKKNIYVGEINHWESGLNGYTIRIIPKHSAMAHPFEDGLIHWFDE
ncbi:MAG: alpha-glucan family phosphorylase [Candidatus Marinimicrobia bacterium]|jgi:starch phosphorylase|nr:alpha-glucan family phosphorylase [Candidatus Neomarinimicrobiota bacterium]